MASKEHWQTVYSSKPTDAVNGYQRHADRSLQLIAEAGVQRSAAIIDIGGGASTPVDDLLNRGFRNITVLDIAGAVLEAARGTPSTLAAETPPKMIEVAKPTRASGRQVATLIKVVPIQRFTVSAAQTVVPAAQAPVRSAEITG